MKYELIKVQPPNETTIDPIGETIGLCYGLKTERSMGQFRCAECNRMQPAGSLIVWIPHTVKSSDSEWSITEAARQNTYNGKFTSWCRSCAPKKSNKFIMKKIIDIVQKMPKIPTIFSRLKNFPPNK